MCRLFARPKRLGENPNNLNADLPNPNWRLFSDLNRATLSTHVVDDHTLLGKFAGGPIDGCGSVYHPCGPAYRDYASGDAFDTCGWDSGRGPRRALYHHVHDVEDGLSDCETSLRALPSPSTGIISTSALTWTSPTQVEGRAKFRLLKRSRHRPLQEQNNQRGSRLGSLYYDNITTLITCPRRSRGCG